MYVKKLRRKCGVRGCRNIDTYSISLSREAGNTVIMCKSCIGKALGAIDDIEEGKPRIVPHTEAPALFFNRRTALAAVEEPTEEAEGFVCPHCGQVCKSELGLQAHIKAKHKGDA